jgi:hypothetical protein
MDHNVRDVEYIYRENDGVTGDFPPDPADWRTGAVDASILIQPTKSSIIFVCTLHLSVLPSEDESWTSTSAIILLELLHYGLCDGEIPMHLF